MLDFHVKHTSARSGYAHWVDTMADRIRSLREARGFSQTQLGEACGVTKSAVSQWELGQTANIKLKVFLALCEKLGTDPLYLVYGPERARPSPGAGNIVRLPKRT